MERLLPPLSGFRRRRWRPVLAAATVLAVTVGLPLAPVSAAPAPVREPAGAADAAVQVLVFHGPAGEQQDPVLKAADEITEVGEANGVAVTVSEDPAVFSPANLANYRGVVFLSSAGAVLSGDQETALQNYIKAGNGFLGVADAAKAQPESTWFTSLIGTRPVGAIRAALPVSAVTASAENPPNETKEKLIDNNSGTKWLTFATTGWAAFRLTTPAAVNGYALTSANDFPGRAPRDWTLQGSQNGTDWVDVDRRTGQTFAERFQTRVFDVANTTTYAHYRLNITANSGEPIIQLADLRLFAGSADPPPPAAVQQSVVDILDRQHPATAELPLKVTRSDRWYNWDPNPIGTVHTVAQVEEWKHNPGQGGNGAFHPVSWCRDFEGGRSFYTGMGHTVGSYDEAAFRTHLAGALRWTTGIERGDCQATIASNYKVERLTAANQTGQLDQIGEPHGMTVAQDNAIFYVGKAACPTGAIVDWNDPNVGLGCGTIHRYDPATKTTKLLTTLAVMGNRGSGGELVKNEEGLLGVVTDPNFTTNNWIYVYWMPHASIDRTTRVGQRTISRFTYDKVNNTIDQSTRKDLLQFPVQIHSCCHAGGGMTFDNNGNLYVGSGDNNSSEGSSGYSGNNWTQEFAGISFQDARRTSGNTNDLAGKIIRIHPEADGTYSIPSGNLFPPGTAKTRPEIYVMGVRNIARLQWDPVHNWRTAGWVGPDAAAPNPELGPAKYETATVITEAGNHGWPYCMGNKQPYRDRSNTDATVLTGWYDCDNPKNNSPRNTGLVDLPPVKNNMIWYAPDGGGPVFPNRPGSNIPTYNAADATYTQPYLRGGGQAVMSGPTYLRSKVNTNSGVAWPAYWDNKWFIGDESNSTNRVAITIDPSGVATAAPPVFAESLRAIIPAGGSSTTVQSWMDAKFGNDGALYLLDYGGGFFTLHSNQKMVRVTYQGGAATPAPAALAVAVQNKPLTYAFNGSRSGGIRWEWSFGDGATSTEANPRHTYARVGTYTARLTVTYADGEVAEVSTTVTVGCAVPDRGATVTIGDTDTGVANRAVGGGCTVDDLIDDDSTWADHDSFVRHVTAVADRLQRDGVLNGRESGALTRAAASSPIGRTGHTGYEAIFDGTPESLTGWVQAPSGSFKLQPDGSLLSQGGLGMLWYGAKEYGNFSLKLQFRDVSVDPTRANSGVFVRFPDPRIPLAQRPEGSCGTIGSARTSQAWVAIYCGHEIQMYDGETGEPQKTGSVYNFDPIGLPQSGATPKGVWSDYEIRVVGQHYTMTRNGVVINEFDNTPGKQSSRAGDPPTDLRQFLSGFIGLQNHGGNDLMELRNVRVRTL